MVQTKDGTVVAVASAFSGHKQAIKDRDHKFLRKAVEEAYKGVDYTMQAKKAGFKETHTFEERKAQCDNLQTKHAGKIPVICEKGKKSKLKDLEKSKYLAPESHKVCQFIHLIRSSMNLNKDEALFLFVKGKTLLKSDAKLGEIYPQYKEDDGFLYLEYNEYSSFGSAQEEL